MFEKLAECYAEVSDAYTDETGSPYYCDDEPNYLDEYADALPDDLPVIPKSISDAIKFYWTTYGNEKGLTDLLFDLVEPWRIGVEKVVYAIHEDTRKYYLLHSDA